MIGIIDMCGIPLDLSTVTDFQICHVEYIYQPAYREMSSSYSFFSKKQKRLEFVRMEPYGVVLGNYESVNLEHYYSHNMGDAIAQQLTLTTLGVIDGIGNVVTDMLHIETIENKSYRIRRHSGVVEVKRLRDIPVKVYYTDGHIADVAKNSRFLADQTDPVTSTVMEVEALLIKAAQPLVIFGNGIDMEDVRVPYHYLLNIKEQELIEAQKEKQLPDNGKKNFSFPRINIPNIQFRSPITIAKREKLSTEMLPTNNGVTENTKE